MHVSRTFLSALECISEKTVYTHALGTLACNVSVTAAACMACSVSVAAAVCLGHSLGGPACDVSVAAAVCVQLGFEAESPSKSLLLGPRATFCVALLLARRRPVGNFLVCIFSTLRHSACNMGTKRCFRENCLATSQVLYGFREN